MNTDSAILAESVSFSFFLCSEVLYLASTENHKTSPTIDRESPTSEKQLATCAPDLAPRSPTRDFFPIGSWEGL